LPGTDQAGRNAGCVNRSVKPSSPVAAFDLLCEVQSDKASVEITSPFDGVVKELLVKEGEIAKVGEGLCLIEVEEDDAKTADAEPPEQHSKPTQTSVQLEQTPNKEFNNSETSHTLHPLDPQSESHSTSSKTGRGGAEILATPSVRHFAKQRGVNLAQVAPGSGRGGRIEKRNIEAFLNGFTSAFSESTITSDAPPAGEVTVELGRTRLAMWKAMTKVSLCITVWANSHLLSRASRFHILGM
jgi:2-oxoisovalerate dehydrogenase E2 component (dihydrolipoyl transacylase)